MPDDIVSDEELAKLEKPVDGPDDDPVMTTVGTWRRFATASRQLRRERDEFRATCEDLLELVIDAIMHGMPVTTKVASVRNQACELLGKDRP